ncbi:hypothetical protein BDB00DRAFT_943598 [Zychaea mexicana]|uniref:uncharacterized protein n=1 Tax=Zychaea mexicana TaxID=64656 RepID=UPI0022FE5A75|nr:uncharacterized protein BDB00DRAFT_943598 [Zychaea mexicana]KAI9474835.1 hypothetical protein BDB00DRAFT_943598 [Zychaea mexicana]
MSNRIADLEQTVEHLNLGAASAQLPTYPQSTAIGMEASPFNVNEYPLKACAGYWGAWLILVRAFFKKKIPSQAGEKTSIHRSLLENLEQCNVCLEPELLNQQLTQGSIDQQSITEEDEQTCQANEEEIDDQSSTSDDDEENFFNADHNTQEDCDHESDIDEDEGPLSLEAQLTSSEEDEQVTHLPTTSGKKARTKGKSPAQKQPARRIKQLVNKASIPRKQERSPVISEKQERLKRNVRTKSPTPVDPVPTKRTRVMRTVASKI